MRAVLRPHGSDDMARALLAPFALLFILALAACSSQGSVERSVSATAPGEEPRTEVTGTGAGETTVGVAAHAGETEGRSGASFGSRPEASGGASYEADAVLAVRYGEHAGYERVVLDLGTGEQPAETVPEWTLMASSEGGLLRVTLPSMSRTAVSDGPLGDALLDNFYVVRAPEGGMFVDVLARKSFEYRVMELSDPARLVVDFKPSGSPLEARPPAVGGDTVLVEPRAGARVGDPLTVCGYSRNFEASNTIVLTDPRGETVIRRTVLSNDWASTWGYFEATLDLPSFTGRGTLRVGAESARDGTFEGVEVPVKGR
jgi:Immunoglobulin-like domain of bacterial spore germination